MRQSKRDMILAASFFLTGVILYLIIPIFAPGKPGVLLDSRFFPQVIAIAIVAISVLMFANNYLLYLHDKRTEALHPTQIPQASAKPSATDWINERRAFILLGIILLYALLFKPLGFLISTVLATTGILVALKVRKIWSYVIVYTFSAVIYLIFKFVLYVRLP